MSSRRGRHPPTLKLSYRRRRSMTNDKRGAPFSAVKGASFSPISFRRRHGPFYLPARLPTQSHLSGRAGVSKKSSHGLMNFVSAVAYHICLNLPEKFLQPGAHFFF